MTHDHSCCPPALTNARLFSAWDEAKRALGGDADHAGQTALRMIAKGDKPTMDDLGRHLGWARERLSAALDLLDDAGLLTRDGHEITGAMGLTYLETEHALALDGRPLHTWCALDAVGIPTALGLDATIRSSTVNNGQPVEIRIERGRVKPADRTVEVLVTMPGAQTTFVEDECPQIAFYEAGTAPQRSDARAITLDEAARLGRRIWSQAP